MESCASSAAQAVHLHSPEIWRSASLVVGPGNRQRFPRLDPNEYAQADVYWELTTGEAVIHLFAVEPMYSGYQLAVLNLP